MENAENTVIHPTIPMFVYFLLYPERVSYEKRLVIIVIMNRITNKYNE